MFQINLVYTNAGPDHVIYESDAGQIRMSQERRDDMVNVGMGYHSIRDRQPNDSFLLMEPFCVSPEDYNPEFLKGFKRVFTWAVDAVPSDLQDVVRIHHPCNHHVPKELAKDIHPWHERADEIAIIANNKRSDHNSQLYTLRTMLADQLHARSHFRVAWYGEDPGGKPYFKGRVESKHDALKKVKFVICSENCYDLKYSANYLTEKMPDVWLAGAVPIYMGCYNIDDFDLFEHSYIDLRMYVEKRGHSININLPPLLSRIHDYSPQQYANYIDGIKGGLLANDKLYNLTSYPKAFDIMLNSLRKE